MHRKIHHITLIHLKKQRKDHCSDRATKNAQNFIETHYTGENAWAFSNWPDDTNRQYFVLRNFQFPKRSSKSMKNRWQNAYSPLSIEEDVQ